MQFCSMGHLSHLNKDKKIHCSGYANISYGSGPRIRNPELWIRIRETNYKSGSRSYQDIFVAMEKKVVWVVNH
jgi:hypothetical protein